MERIDGRGASTATVTWALLKNKPEFQHLRMPVSTLESKHGACIYTQSSPLAMQSAIWNCLQHNVYAFLGQIFPVRNHHCCKELTRYSLGVPRMRQRSLHRPRGVSGHKMLPYNDCPRRPSSCCATHSPIVNPLAASSSSADKNRSRSPSVLSP
eukprot:COSAG02_NODE_4550_length_5224_cov_94.387512_3_plen_154_part_00